MNYKCQHCNSTLPAHIATCSVLSEHNNVATWEEITRLREENERLRKELASYRKGDCRRKIDKAMEGE